MIKRTSVLILVILLALPVMGKKRAFTLDDYYAVKVVGNPQLSPDGKTIAFTLKSRDLANSKEKTQIWLMNTRGKKLRQLTHGEESASRPRWHPSGKYLMYVAEDSVIEQSQAFQITLDGKEITKLTDFSMGVEHPGWSPDGEYIIFTARVFPEAGADSRMNKIIQENMDAGPVHAHMADELLYRHWNYFKDGKRQHIFSRHIDSGKLVDLTPGNWESPRFDISDGDGYAISPDGKEIVYVSNHDKESQSSTNGDLWAVPIDGGEAVNLTQANPAYDGFPAYSPDGRYIAYIMQRQPGYEADLFRLAVYDTQTKKHEVLTEDFRDWVTDFAWAPDGSSIYFTAPREGHYPVFNIELQSRKIAEVLGKVYIRGFHVSPDNKTIYYASTTIDQPTEIFAVETDNKRPVQLTDVNRELLKEVDFRPFETAWVTSTDGKKVHVFIIKPHGFDPKKKYPLLLNVHGGPQGMYGNSFRVNHQLYPGYGYVVAFSNPRGSIGYSQEFCAEISGDWGGQVFRDLMAVTDYLETLPYVDRDRIGAMGWSYGGYMMNWFEGHTDRFKALASMMGVYDLRSMWGATEELWFPRWDLGGTPWTSDQYIKWSPSNYVQNFSTPCLVITGMLDFRVPYTQSLQFFTDLQEMGVPSRLIIFEDDGHWPSVLKSMPLYYNAHLDWFHKYLGGKPAPYHTKDLWRNQTLEWGKKNDPDE
ncbi:MAG: S9 family peptidase [Candidatus Marinimicrobia bacterium]|nr:S9 family peptidase [Candidatus Neomarinimicrobiota bacterium]